ncbi:MAG: aldo/keto reductase [Trebonia sp.]
MLHAEFGEVRAVAARHGVSPARVAIAWLLAQRAVTSVIVGARRLDQLAHCGSAGRRRPRTGDVGRIDTDGYVQVLDRLKDMIIQGGENIYSLEVEGALARHPAIAEVAVVGAPDELFGERVRAVAVLRPGSRLTVDELRAWAVAEIADYKLPAELVTVPELPRNANGKC